MMNEKLHDPIEGVAPDGTIVTGASEARLSPEFLPILEAVKKRLPPEVSLYAYGSVANGTARVGESDVDLVTVGLDSETAKDLGATLSEEFSKLCRGVEIGPGQRTGYEGSDDESHGNRVFLRHYCVHLAGPDFRDEFPNYPANTDAARGFNGDIGICADRWKAELEQGGSPALLGRKIARKTLFAVAGLVSVHDQTWTTDRIGAAQRWGEVTPSLSEDLDTLVLWGDGQTQNVSEDEVKRMLTDTVTKVVNDFSDKVGLWNE